MDKIILVGKTNKSISLKGKSGGSISVDSPITVLNQKWGDIEGNLENQTDLIEYIADQLEHIDLSKYYTKTEIDGKVDTINGQITSINTQIGVIDDKIGDIDTVLDNINGEII